METPSVTTVKTVHVTAADLKPLVGGGQVCIISSYYHILCLLSVTILYVLCLLACSLSLVNYHRVVGQMQAEMSCSTMRERLAHRCLLELQTPEKPIFAYLTCSIA